MVQTIRILWEQILSFKFPQEEYNFLKEWNDALKYKD